MHRIAKALRIGVAVLLLTGWLSVPVHADEYDVLRAKVVTQLAGGTEINRQDPEIAGAITAVDQNARIYWDTLNKNPDRNALWSDLADWSSSATIVSHYARLSVMATAYTAVGSLHGNQSLATDIVTALDWMYAHHYNESITYYDNWWSWQIGAPIQLGNTMLLMYEQLSPAQRTHYIAAMDWFTPDPRVKLTPRHTAGTGPVTGANRLDKALVTILSGIAGKSAAKLTMGRDAISDVLKYVTSGDGFYADGSFIQHEAIAYTAGYGMVLINDVAKLTDLLANSHWAITDPNLENIWVWINRAFCPLVFNGAMTDAVKGRGISRSGAGDHGSGRELAVAMIRLAQLASPTQAATMRSVVKGWIARDSYFKDGYFSITQNAHSGIAAVMPVSDIALLKTMLTDPAIPASPEADGVHVYASMDRVIQRGSGFGFVVSMFSQRISAFEYGNGENRRGWWSGIGMTSLYNADQRQYNDAYWPTVDAYRLAGTTTDHSGAGVPKPWAALLNTSRWVGGTELNGRYGVAGMEFSTLNVTGSVLQGKKSWFLFGDKIIAVGSGISSSDDVKVETIVDNRRLNQDGRNPLTIDGMAMPLTSGWQASLPGVRWAYLAGATHDADIGYVFLDAPVIDALREYRSGAWRDINAGQSPAPFSNHYLSLAIPHGSHPAEASYSYVILPGRSAAQVAAFAADSRLHILERSAEVSAVSDSSLGLVGANFWLSRHKTVQLEGQSYLSCDSQASVLTHEAEGILEISLADPTQNNTGTINIEIAREADALLSSSPEVTVTQLKPVIRLSMSVKGAAGQSGHASFRLRPGLANQRADHRGDQELTGLR